MVHVGGLKLKEVEEGRVVHGGRGPRLGHSRKIGGGAVYRADWDFIMGYILFIYVVYWNYLNMLCDCVTRGCGDHSPLTTAAILEWRRRSAWGGAAAACRGQRGE